MHKYDFEQIIKGILFDRQEFLFSECKRLFNCAGIDPNNFENDYLLPSIILYVSIKKLNNLYIPLSGKNKKIAKNLEKF